MFWDDLTYLNRGSERQRDAFRVLIDLDLFSVLAEYDPHLAGTYPLGIETPQSDLDILCCAKDLTEFSEAVVDAYGNQDDFTLGTTEEDGLPTVVCNFTVGNIPIELFAQDRPSEEQNAYRHLVAEARLLREGGEDALLSIRTLKSEGLKTEPAFGHYFCLPGDPYVRLLEIADASAEEVCEIVIQAKFDRRNRPERLPSVLEA